MKRQRGRGRKPGHHNSSSRTFESTGPDIKVRGPAAHVYEKYLQLARDASSSGDRVMAENYMQHAEHYYRILRTMQPAQAPHEQRFASDSDFEDEEGGEASEADGEGEDAPEPRHTRPPQQREQREHREQRERRERPPRERSESGDDGEGAEGEEASAGEGGGKRGRRRRRFRPGEGRDGQNGGDVDRPVEGFGDQLPAFVAGE